MTFLKLYWINIFLFISTKKSSVKLPYEKGNDLFILMQYFYDKFLQNWYIGINQIQNKYD